MQTRIIRASSEQLGVVLVLVERLLAELSDQGNPSEALDCAGIVPQLIAASDRFIAFLALNEEGTPIGVVTLTEAVAVYAGGLYGIISELYVEPAYRSTGIRRELLKVVHAEARSRGWTRVDVAAPPASRWDRTFRFYVQNGFVFTGRKLKYLLTAAG